MRYLAIFVLLICLPLSTKAQDKDNCNCCTEKHAEFDFWIGNWEVTQANGSPAGTNVIEKIQDNCVLRENWTSASTGFTGTSYNFYNTSTKQWEQLWLDNQGGRLHLKGHRSANQMILQSDELKNKDGQPFYHRITWTKNDDGSVRQYWEVITNGSEISVAFDGLYKKVR